MAELVSGGDGQGRVEPVFDLDAQGAASPAGAGVADAGHGGGSVFGGGDHAWLDAIDTEITKLRSMGSWQVHGRGGVGPEGQIQRLTSATAYLEPMLGCPREDPAADRPYLRSIR